MADPLDMFSNAFAPLETTATQTVNLPVPGYRTNAQLHHSMETTKRPRILCDLTGSEADDKYVMAKMKSSDHISSLRVSGKGGGASLAADLGVYLVGDITGAVGTVVDVDLFASAAVLAAAARLDVFKEAALVDADRGLPIWELLGLSADPLLEYYIAFTVTTALITADETVLLEIIYNAG